MKTNYWLIVLLIGLCYGCEKEPQIIDPIVPKDGQIDFSKLQAGQESFYMYYESNCEDLDGNFKFSGDTLSLRIVEGDGNFFMEESYTPGSPIYIGGNDQKVRYPLIDRGGLLELPERGGSQVFNFYGSDSLHLVQETPVELKQNGCLVDIKDETFKGDEIGALPHFVLGANNEVEVKDKIAVSCIPMIDVDGYLIYDQHQLHISHIVMTSTFNDITETFVRGWCLVE